jgi:hypothetical protein
MVSELDAWRPNSRRSNLAVFLPQAPANTRIRVRPGIISVHINVVRRIGAVGRAVTHDALMHLCLFHLVGGGLVFGSFRLCRMARNKNKAGSGDRQCCRGNKEFHRRHLPSKSPTCGFRSRAQQNKPMLQRETNLKITPERRSGSVARDRARASLGSQMLDKKRYREGADEIASHVRNPGSHRHDCR